MLAYGVCVGPSDNFTRLCRPGITAVRRPGSPLYTVRGQRSLFDAYNTLFDQAAADPAVSGLVLLHDDVELRADPADVAEPILADASVGLVGSLGGSDTVSLAWWNEKTTRRGRVTDYDKCHDHGPGRHDVHALDDVILVAGRRVLEHVRFPAGRYRGFEGLGVVLATLARAAGYRVVVEDLREVMHHNEGRGFNGLVDWRRNELRWQRQFFALTPRERLVNHVADLAAPLVPARIAARRAVLRAQGRGAETSDGESGDPAVDVLVDRWYRDCGRLRGRIVVPDPPATAVDRA